MPEQTWAYIARTTKKNKHNDANVIVATVVDEPELAKIVAREIGKWVRGGCVVEHVPIEWVRENFMTTNRWEPGDAR